MLQAANRKSLRLMRTRSERIRRLVCHFTALPLAVAGKLIGKFD